MNWLFRDLTTRRGNYVIAEVPNRPLLIFMAAIVVGVAVYPGFIQKLFLATACIALFYWGIKEYRSGRSRFRKLLGMLGMLSAVGAVFLIF